MRSFLLCAALLSAHAGGLGAASAAPVSLTVNGTRLPERRAKPVAGGAVVPQSGTLPLTLRGAQAGDQLCSDSDAFYQINRLDNIAGKVTQFYANYAGLLGQAKLWVVRGKSCAGPHLADFEVRAEGSTLWQATFPAQSPENRPPVVAADGTIYVLAGKDELHALTLAGGLKWRVALPKGAWSEWSSGLSLGPDGTLYAGLFNGDLVAFAPTGKEKWRFRTAALVVQPPTFGADGTVYLGATDHKLYALTPQGQKKWVYRAGQHIIGPTLRGPDGTLYFGADDRLLYAVGPNGKLRWKLDPAGERAELRAIGADGTLYATSFGPSSWKAPDNALLMALSPAGKVIWQRRMGYAQSVTIGQGGTLYVESFGKLSALTTAGQPKWTFNGGEANSSAGTQVIGTDDTIYFTNNARIYALNADGSLKWLRELAQEPLYLNMNRSGDLLVSAWNGRVFALATTSRALAKAPWPTAAADANR